MHMAQRRLTVNNRLFLASSQRQKIRGDRDLIGVIGTHSLTVVADRHVEDSKIGPSTMPAASSLSRDQGFG